MDNRTRIIKVKKNKDDDITDVMLENGNVFSINEAIDMARDGLIEGVNIGEAKNGKQYLRSNPNSEQSDNLDNLPSF